MITLSGTIGAGKTSLTSKLAPYLGTKPFYEPVKNNPVLPLFYRGNQMVRAHKWHTNPYTFLLQIYFLNMRFHMIKQAMQNDNNVLDRSIYEDRLFMKMNYDLGNTTKPEWDIYKSLLANMMEELPYAAHKKAPDLMVYIKVSLRTELKHIAQRGRPYEQPTKTNGMVKYYKDLQRYYARWFDHYNISPKMVINGDKYDFVNNHHDLMIVLHNIKHKLHNIHELSRGGK